MKQARKQLIFHRDRKKNYPMIDRGEGIYLYDEQGKAYLDASGGPLVVNIGHGVPEVIEAMRRQAEKVCFPYSAHFVTQSQIDFAAEVIKMAPPNMTKVYPVSGGSEATEIAVKMTRQYFLGRGEPERTKIISRWQSYHGATLGALSVGGHTLYRQDYLPLLLNMPHIPAPYCYRCPFEKEYPGCELVCARCLERAIKDEGKSSIAAFIVEPMTGGTLGALTPPPEYFHIIKDICERYGVLLIVDEVITGFGRTGANFGIDHYRVQPDLIVTAKGASSGYAPLGSVIISEKVSEVFETKRTGFQLGYTFSGNPVSCAVGAAVLRYIAKHDLVTRAQNLGEYLFDRFERLKEIPLVGDIRGKGLLLGIELVKDKKSKTPFARNLKLAETITARALAQGLIIMPGHGFKDDLTGDILMIAPPFIVREEEIDKIADKLAAIIQMCSEKI